MSSQKALFGRFYAIAACIRYSICCRVSISIIQAWYFMLLWQLFDDIAVNIPCFQIPVATCTCADRPQQKCSPREVISTPALSIMMLGYIFSIKLFQDGIFQWVTHFLFTKFRNSKIPGQFRLGKYGYPVNYLLSKQIEAGFHYLYMYPARAQGPLPPSKIKISRNWGNPEYKVKKTGK